MIRRLRAWFRAPEPVVDMVDIIIATRALRLHNRSRGGASAYRRVHAILKQGMRK